MRIFNRWDMNVKRAETPGAVKVSIGRAKEKPKRKRIRYIQKPKGKSFQAAQQTNLTYSWTSTPVTLDQILRGELSILRARARDQFRNNDYARRFVKLAGSNVIGHNGITLQGRIRVAPGKDKPLDEMANWAVETGWKDWGTGYCDIGGRMSMVELENLWLKTLLIDGEVLVRFIRGREAGKYGFAVQFIDAELLATTYFDKLRNGNVVKLGIELNKWDRPVAYYIKDVDRISTSYASARTKYLRIPASNIMHNYIIEDVGQRRGVPQIATPLMRMNMLAGYEDAALVNARVGAAKAGFYRVGDEEAFEGDDDETDGYNDVEAELVEEVEAGTFKIIGRDVTLEKWEPPYPNGEFPEFVQAMLRGIASGLGVSYVSLANDLKNMSYTSIRAGLLEERATWMGMQIMATTKFHSRLNREWLLPALVTGELQTPNGGMLNFNDIERYRSVLWQPRGWDWVDPLRDIKASTMAIQWGINSWGQIIRMRGGDREDTWQEVMEEHKSMLKKEIKFPMDIKGGDDKLDAATLDKDD